MKLFATFTVLAVFVAASLLHVPNAMADKPSATSNNQSVNVQFEETDSTVKVMLGGQHFTTFDFGNYAKPILYPILGPNQTGMTRNWPMNKDVKGEAHDHPHHKSMWISHEISGVDFWAETEGKVKTNRVEISQSEKNMFRATSSWIKKDDGEQLLTDHTEYRFGAGNNSRWIDCTITYDADQGEIVFDDTKEGLFAIRTHPDLRLKNRPKDGVVEVFGKARNSEGVEGKAIWGKKAKWLLYQGPIDGKPMSIAMYDHPTNLRHPTTWHARDYGLVTSNPFGMHHFLGKEKGEGAFTIKKGDSLSLRYRVEFIDGLATPKQIESRYEAFCQPIK